MNEDSMQGDVHFKTLRFIPILIEESKKILRERDSQTLLLALQVQKFRDNKLLETILVKVILHFKHE